MNTQEKNNQQAKAVKRVLTVDALRHQPGMAAQTGIKAGMKYVVEAADTSTKYSGDKDYWDKDWRLKD